MQAKPRPGDPRGRAARQHGETITLAEVAPAIPGLQAVVADPVAAEARALPVRPPLRRLVALRARIRLRMAQALHWVTWSALTVGLQGAGQFILLAVLARRLTPAEFGLVTATLIVVNLGRMLTQAAPGPALIQRQDLTPPHVRSALFVDFDNIYLGLQREDPNAAEQFATNPSHWLHWLQESLSLDSEELGMIRKCWEVGVERVLLQTCVQIDGDVPRGPMPA